MYKRQDIVIISAVMPLVPGVIFTTAVRDTLNGDYSSGAVSYTHLDEIDKLRHSATAALSEREDVIIVASVSCIYGLGSPCLLYTSRCV